ncbi:hypothetical protein BJ138DRAFT_171878 [Hygrophoropsis aurantiaca]|uniref:Uncharacterized protein n=1 Tax=Hygrophoropsis aurantiaca TaxID=72124 RepID=A0ACB8APR4_9AGAM|nr:hypothetical protein BJ138DRAFT_171878 [Hygrophoropsis aurantiaca]
MVKFRDLKKSTEDLLLIMESNSTSPTVLRDAFTVVLEKRAKLTDYINCHCSPIYRLPTEILVLIFELAVDQSDDPDFPYVDEQLPEFIISHVSRHWRGIAVNSPSLWTKWVSRITTSNELLSIYCH